MLIFVFFFAFLSSSLLAYDIAQLNVGVWLSGAAYCGREKYKTMLLGGPASGFIHKETLYDVKTDLQGYIGVLPTMKTIYVVLRGTSSTMNWLDDLEVKLVPYESFGDCECKVHYGFYRSAMSIVNQTVDAVKLLRLQYPFYSVVVTGHSYGAGCGQLLAMELERKGIDVKIYDYGQPRVGDAKYAAFVNTKIPEHYRMTHNKDIVPHVPPIDVFGYYHSCREIFEDSSGNLTTCSAIRCEDPNCADQFPLYQTNVDDHLYYLGHRLSCENSTI